MQIVIAAGSNLTLNDFTFAVAAVELVEDLAVELHLDLRAPRRPHERRAVGPTRGRPGEGAGPLDAPSAVTTPSSSRPSSGRASSKTSIPPKSARRCRRGCRSPCPRTSGCRRPRSGLERLRAQVLRAGPDVGDAPIRSLRLPSPRWIIGASKPAPAMTANRSPLNRPTSSWRRGPCSPTRPPARCPSGSRGSSRADWPCRRG